MKLILFPKRTACAIFSVALLSCFSAVASGPRCTEVFSKIGDGSSVNLEGKKRPVVEIIRVDPKSNGREVRAITEVFDLVSDKLSSTLVIPEKVQVEIFRQGSKFEVTQMDGGVHVGFQYLHANRYTKHPSHARALTAHEFGHVIFLRNLGKSYPELAEHFHVLKQLANEEKLRNKELMDRYKQASERGTITDALDLEMDQMFAGRAQSFGNELLEMNKTMRSYEELFADLVAIVALGNPRAISDALFYTGEPSSYASAKLRDFTAKFQLVNWDKSEDHEMLAPTRSHIWHRYLSKPLFALRPEAIVADVLEAISSELRKLCGAGLPCKSLLPKERNQSLIQSIDRQIIAR